MFRAIWSGTEALFSNEQVADGLGKGLNICTGPEREEKWRFGQPYMSVYFREQRGKTGKPSNHPNKDFLP